MRRRNVSNPICDLNDIDSTSMDSLIQMSFSQSLTTGASYAYYNREGKMSLWSDAYWVHESLLIGLYPY